MVLFIYFLRTIAACLITNSHYTGIYPTDIIANGGLIGDVVFFAVSGYCLFNINNNFLTWYLKRIIRVFLPVWVVTTAYIILGFYNFTDMSLLEYYIYPTYYHFVASIIVLYIPYYFIIKNETTKNKIVKVMCVVACVMMVVYLTLYDKSYYHIDNVREPYVRFLFFESMLLGGYFRKNENLIRNNNIVNIIIKILVVFIIYFISKISFSKGIIAPELQVFNQIIIFILLIYIFLLFIKMEEYLYSIPEVLIRVVKYIAEMTLEIYLVQYVIIDYLRGKFNFPVNWFVITISIILTARIFYLINQRITNAVLKR